MSVTSVCFDMGLRLQDSGVGTVGTDLFEGFLPSSPDSCIALYEFQAQKPERTSAKTVAVEYANLKVLVKNVDYETGFQKASAARASLQNFSGVSGGGTYLDVSATSSVISLGRDDNGAFKFSVNFRLMRVPQ